MARLARGGGSLPYDIALSDSCLGGSTVAARLARGRTGLRAFYLADYRVNPLGLKSESEVGATLVRWYELARSLAATLVIACNTASVLYARARPDGGARPPRRPGDLGAAAGPARDVPGTSPAPRVWSMVDLVDAVIASHADAVRGRRVCLMGTRFTVAQPIYSGRLLAAGAAEVVPLAATRTEHVVAQLLHHTPQGRRDIADEIGDALRSCDAVLLACTCFPLAEPVIRRVNPACALLDPAEGASALRMPARNGPNRLTVALTGSTVEPGLVRSEAGVLFPGWQVDEIVGWDGRRG